ncbi:MAG: transposase [Lewinella sp.]
MQTRKTLRLSGYDYSKPNAFFVTICCDRHRHIFGHIANGVMQRNPNGQFAHDQWLALAATYPHITLGEFVIMPNHMHGIIYLGEWDDGYNKSNLVDTGELAGGGEPLPCQPDSNKSVREGLTPSLRLAYPHTPPSLSDIIGAYKSLTYRDCLKLAKTNNERLGKLWHRSFYEIIIRTPEAARRIRHYIRNNVRTWARDKFHGG